MTEFQLFLSTAEDEANYFTGRAEGLPAPASPVAPGLYRVIDGQLFRVVPGVAPAVTLPPAPPPELPTKR